LGSFGERRWAHAGEWSRGTIWAARDIGCRDDAALLLEAVCMVRVERYRWLRATPGGFDGSGLDEMWLKISWLEGSSSIDSGMVCHARHGLHRWHGLVGRQAGRQVGLLGEVGIAEEGQ